MGTAHLNKSDSSKKTVKGLLSLLAIRLPFEELTSLISGITTRVHQLDQFIENRHRKKFEFWTHKYQFPSYNSCHNIQKDVILNLANINLSEDHISLLTKGLKYRLPTKQDPLRIISCVESSLQNQSNFDKYHIRTTITNKLYASGHSNPSHKSSKNEVKALKSLRERSERHSGHQIRQRFTGDLDTFEGASPAQVSNIQKAYKSSLSRLKRTNQITSAQFQSYTSNLSNTPYIYGLPKVHKPDIPLRPIVAYHLSPAAYLARYLSDVLKPLTKTYNSHSIQDSSDFIHKLKEIDNLENYSICTYDVKSFFLCLPHDLIIKELSKLLASSDLPHTQKERFPMGSPLSNIAAELVMSGLDSWITKRDDLGIKLWVRYVDDIFCMYPNANNSLITDALNTYHECLKFTQNQDKNGVIPFLDVLVINTGSSIETPVYYKPEFNPTYIHYGSHAPASHKITTIKTLTKRISTHCSLEIFRTVERNNVYRNLSSFGYPIDFIRRHTYQQRTYATPTVYKSTCVLPYSETKVDIACFLRKYGVRTYFSNSPSVELKLRHPITKSSKKQDPLSAPNAVYKIKCSNCELHYVGETGRTIEIRTKEHNRNIMNKDSRSQIYQHKAETQHSFDFTDTQCIYSNIRGKYQRLVLEALVSNKIPSLNRKIELPPQYIAF
ncbi:hypothetical protein LAZ67_15000215 [Cordylochernes scorpioides]|uniref:Reverse transcriptase domain-containing protein n=1 Tax=Cordylochernes scorpioides TaxID=51811 RepID=A0ABY6L882_9ARAC|nr:hypothetical protein LAZ67_15000215 [Cordylochernes scorpioides]